LVVNTDKIHKRCMDILKGYVCDKDNRFAMFSEGSLPDGDYETLIFKRNDSKGVICK